MPIWSLLLACYNDRYLNYPVPEEADTAQEAPAPPPPCEGEILIVTPDALSFTSIITPFEEDIELRTDMKTVKIKNACDVDVEVYAIVSGGEVGEFALVREDGDRDGAGSGEFTFTIPASESPTRAITYTGDSRRASTVDDDEGNLDVYVIQADDFGFHAGAKLEATVYDATMAQ